MGMLTQGKGLWNALFTRTQRQLLSLFFGYPDRSFYANEIVRKAGVGTGSVQRELARLFENGLVTVTRIGNQKHYQANPDSPIFPELRGIVLKTYGATGILRKALLELPGHIEMAMLYGDHPDPAVSSIKLLLVSNELEHAAVAGGLTETENRLGRSIRPLLFRTEEFREMRAREDTSLRQILRQPRVLLLGSLDRDP